MVRLFGIFQKKEIEEELSALKSQINRAEANVSLYKWRQFRYAYVFAMGASFLYAAVSAFLLYFLPPALEERLLRFLAIAAFPFLIYYGREGIKRYYDRCVKSEETFLQNLRARFQDKVEEFKQTAPYNKVKPLLDELESPARGFQTADRPQPGSTIKAPAVYGATPSKGSNDLRYRPMAGGVRPPGMGPVPMAATPLKGIPTSTPHLNKQTHDPIATPSLNKQAPLKESFQRVESPKPRTILDRVVDLLVGETEATAAIEKLDSLKQENERLLSVLKSRDEEIKRLRASLPLETVPVKTINNNEDTEREILDVRNQQAVGKDNVETNE